MKICPKCGQEFEGDSCPRCTGPEIVVNNNEYLQRKKAYEEKQAKLKSASSNSDAAINPENIDEVFSKLKQSGAVAAKKVQRLGNQSKKKMKHQSRNTKYITKATAVGNDDTDMDGQQENEAEHAKIVLQTRKRSRNKKIYFIIALVAAMVVVTAVTFGIYKLVTRKNYTLYMSYNGKIYNATSLDSSYVCDLSDAVFASDQKTFYKAEWPKDIDKNKLSQSCVSQNGDYFAAVSYDESTAMYALHLWSTDGEMIVSNSKDQKYIKTVTDEGIVIYTDTEVVNDQGYSGATSLYVVTTYLDKSKEKGQQLSSNSTKVESNLMSAYVYAKSNTIVCYNTSNKIYTYDFEKNVKSNTSVSAELLYPMSNESTNEFVSQTTDENLLSGADAYVYLSNGIFYYKNINDDTTITIGKVTGTNITFIYDEKNDGMYAISSGTIKYAEVKKNIAGNYKELDQLGTAQNMIYMSSDNQLLYVNESGKLMTLNKGNTKELRTDVKDGSLSLVGNTDDGITYISGNTQYVKSSLSASEVAIYSENDRTSTIDTYLYKNHLYFYNNAKELYSCTQKGKDVNKIGQVDRLWLGTEWK